MGLISKIKNWLNKVFSEDMDKRGKVSTAKKYVCKDGRTLYPVECRKCGKRTNTSDKETALRNLYVCTKCVPRKKKI